MSDQPPNPYGRRPIGLAESAGPHHPDREDLALFGMQLLVGEEAAAISRHLEHCVACRSELARIYSDLAACALTVDLQPQPDAARDRLVAQVAREKKVVPGPVAIPAAPTQPAIAAFGRSGSVFAIDEARPKRSAGLGLLAAAGWAIAAALAVAVTFLYKDRTATHDALASESGQVQRLNADAASAHLLLDALTDPKAIRVSLTAKPQPKTGPIGGITYNPGKGSLIFLASELEPLPAAKTYELWLIPADGGAPIPAATFHPDSQGNASVILPDLPRGIPAKAFGVTIEADGGAQTPTLPILMAGG
jgi:anti-sigma-K factor RskA